MPTTTYIDIEGTGANTEIDLADGMDAPFDTRGNTDPVVSAKEEPVSDATTGTEYASAGQGAADDPGAGEVVVTGPYSVAFGDSIDADSVVTVAYEAANATERVR